MKKPLSFLERTFEQNRKNTERYSSLLCIFRCFFKNIYFPKRHSQRGSVIFYILVAIALLGMLTFSFVGNNAENMSKQNSYKSSEELYSQFNTMNSAIMACILEFPAGGGDLDGNSSINALDNDNRPYPLSPSDANNPGGAALNDQARNMKCPGSALGIFQGAGSIGHYLAVPPSEFAEWELLNDAAGVRLRTVGSGSGIAADAVRMLQGKFDTCRTDLNYGTCGATCISIWIKKVAGC